MKKTLIALAVAASAAVSGSAMAWTANGTGGSVDLGGTLTPVEKVTPWEVKTGDAVTGLNAQIQKDQKVVDIAVNKVIPVLGIRTVKSTFKGQPGITPNIDYHNAINTSKFSNNATSLTLDVNDANGQKIGKLVTTLTAMGRLSRTGIDDFNMTLYAGVTGHAFFGGVPVNGAGVNDSNLSLVDSVFPGVGDKFTGQSIEYKGIGHAYVDNASGRYSAYYGSGIEQGKTIKITLDQAATGDAPIQWKASLPVTVSYQ
ncbi:hypothetical protein [Escherichia sp. MOD1-EC6163]|uniref:F4 family fimbrial subunit n=1 Tax=Escherichia sp. MOD1-EC6163 TaxID=2093896 RepID=UPI000CF766F2|nr:hypothetical protein [Escherichia sp. MOD1-EC6163]